LASRFHTVHFVWNKVQEVLKSSNRIWKKKQPNTEHRTANNNDEQRRHWSNDNTPEQRQQTNRTSGHRLPSRLRTGVEQDQTPDQFLRFIKLLNRKSTPDLRFRIEQSNSNSNSYSSSWFPLVARYLFTSQDLRSHHG